jgi:large repetitive protein
MQGSVFRRIFFNRYLWIALLGACDSLVITEGAGPIRDLVTEPSLEIKRPRTGATLNNVNGVRFSIGGACENVRKVELQISTIKTEVDCISSTFSWTVDLSGLENGQYTITARVRSEGLTDSVTVQKVISPVSFTSLAIADGANYTRGNSVSLVLSAVSATEMAIFNGAVCYGAATWIPYSTTATKPIQVANARNYFSAKVRDARGNESACRSVFIIHDTVAPTITLNPIAAYVGSAQAAAFPVSGTCSENGRSVSLLSGSGPCTGGVFSFSVNLSALADGTIYVQALSLDAAGNSTLSLPRSVIKDTAAPRNSSVIINAGSEITSDPRVNLTLASIGASEMYLTLVPGCASGGEWEPSAATQSMNLDLDEAVVFAKFRDLAGNESACVSDSIILDTTNPILTIDFPSMLNGAMAGHAPLQGLCSEVGRDVTYGFSAPNAQYVATTRCLAAEGSSFGVWSITGGVNLLLFPDGSNTVTASQTDTAGHTGSATQNFIKDVIAPRLGPTDLSIVGVSAATSLSLIKLKVITDVLVGSVSVGPDCEAVHKESLGVVNPNIVWVDGVGPIYTFSITGPYVVEGPIGVQIFDAAGNYSECREVTVTVDNSAPILSWTELPETGNFELASSARSILFAGSCETGRTVRVNLNALTASETCVNATYSLTLSFASAAALYGSSGTITQADAVGNVTVVTFMIVPPGHDLAAMPPPSDEVVPGDDGLASDN